MEGAHAAELLAVATHELRSPLSSLVGFTETLRDRRHELSEHDLDVCVAAIDRQAQRLTELVDDLLAAALAGAGAHPLETGPVDAASAVHAALADVRFDRGHEVIVSIPDTTVPVAAHGPSLRRVLVNLLTNAQRYSPPRTRIDVCVDDRGDGVALSVRDRGRGIAPDEVARMFTKFQRGPGAAPASCGIGLYVVRRLVDAMGGRVLVDSRVGEGSCFTIVLPYASSREVSTAA